MSTTPVQSPKPIPAPIMLGLVLAGTACSAALLSAGAQPDSSLTDAGLSLLNFVGAYIIAGHAAENLAEHIESRRPGTSDRILASGFGKILTKIASGKFAATLVSSAVAVTAAITSRPLINDMADVSNWGVGMVGASALVATVGLIGIAKDAISDRASNDQLPSADQDNTVETSLRRPGSRR